MSWPERVPRDFHFMLLRNCSRHFSKPWKFETWISFYYHWNIRINIRRIGNIPKLSSVKCLKFSFANGKQRFQVPLDYEQNICGDLLSLNCGISSNGICIILQKKKCQYFLQSATSEIKINFSLRNLNFLHFPSISHMEFKNWPCWIWNK